MKNKIFTIFKKEMKEVFRDKKSLSMMLLIPLMIPLIVIGLSALFNSEINKNLEEYNKIGFAYNLSNEEKAIAKELKLDINTGSKKEIEKLYKQEKIKAYITKDETNYIINYDENNEESASTIILAEKYLEQYKLYLQDKYLKNNSLDSNSVLNIITVKHNSISKKEDNFYVNYIIRNLSRN